MSDAATLIARLGLARHPEGGWFRETHRQPDPAGGRDLSTAILFLLEAGQRSHWHRVDAVETWFWHAGAPLLLRIDHEAILLGGDVLAGQSPQGIVPAHAWQAAEADAGWALVSCVVTPAFDFAGFELAPPGWQPG
jgi:predicted cupin superfamily sugar epimerase